MPKTKVAMCQKETRKKSNGGHTGGKGGGPRHDVQPAARHSSHKRRRGSNIINQQGDATPVTSNQLPGSRTIAARQYW